MHVWTEFQVPHQFFMSATNQSNVATAYWYPLPFTATAAVAEHVSTVYNSSDQHGQSLTFKTFAFFPVETWCRNDHVQA